jgi:hypothetical protein
MEIQGDIRRRVFFCFAAWKVIYKCFYMFMLWLINLRLMLPCIQLV